MSPIDVIVGERMTSVIESCEEEKGELVKFCIGPLPVKVSDVMDELEKNILEPRTVETGKLTEVKPWHTAKAEEPIKVTESGIIIEDNFEHSENALSPI